MGHGAQKLIAMKEKVIEFLKSLPKRYGWKFWALIAMAVFGAVQGWIEEGFVGSLQGIVIMPIATVTCYYICVMVIKATSKTAKVTGKAAGKAAVFAVNTAVSAAANGGGKSSSGKGSTDGAKKDKAAQYRPKEVRKVWTGTYSGSKSNYPRMINVPSINQIGCPTGNEVAAGLIDMGYEELTAFCIGSESCNKHLGWSWK